jgi:hypothetical protein
MRRRRVSQVMYADSRSRKLEPVSSYRKPGLAVILTALIILWGNAEAPARGLGLAVAIVLFVVLVWVTAPSS